MTQAYLLHVDTALAEAFAEHLAPLIQTPRSDPLTRDPLTRDPLTRDPLTRDPSAWSSWTWSSWTWILSRLDESLARVDIAETLESFRVVNEFPILPNYLFTLTWLKRQFKDPNWRDLVASRILSIQRSLSGDLKPGTP